MWHFQRHLILHVIIPIARQSSSVMDYSCACQNHRTKTFHIIYCFVGFVLFCLFCCLLSFFGGWSKHLSIDVVQRFYCSWSVFTTVTSTIADTHHAITLPRIETSGISPWESYLSLLQQYLSVMLVPVLSKPYATVTNILVTGGGIESKIRYYYLFV